MPKRWWLGVALIGLVLPLWAQAPVNAPLPLSGVVGLHANSPSAHSSIGQFAADLLPGNGTRGGYLLRYAPVIPGSESVYVDGKRLTPEVDYWIDYHSGNLAFAQPIRKFSSIQVYYRYNPEGRREATIGAMPIFTLSIGQASTLSVLFTPDMAEATQNGGTERLGAYGLQNALHFGNTTLSGYFFIGTRQPMPNRDLKLHDQPVSPSTAERSQFIYQTLQMQSGSLRLKATYQDIGHGFSPQKLLGMQSGIEPAQLQLWEKQKGLKRFDYTLGLTLFRNAGIDLSQLRIRDGKGEVEQRAMRFHSQRLNLHWNLRKPGREFQRFEHLADPDAPHWQRERGITRESFMGNWQLSANSTLHFSELTLTEDSGRIERLLYGLDMPWLKIQRLEQAISPDFKRFGDLGDAEKGDWAREAGLKRETTTLQLCPTGLKVHATDASVRSPTGTMEWERVQVQTDTLTVEHIHRDIDAQFGRLQSLAPQELQQMAQETRQFHDPANNQPLKPEEVQQSLKEAGLARTFQRVEIQPTKDLNLQVKHYTIEDRNEQGNIAGIHWQFKSPTLQVRIAERTISPHFNRLRDLAPIEQMLFRNEQGIRRSDWDATLITPRLGLAVAHMQARAIGAGLKRRSYRLIHPQLEIAFHQRQVDADFARAQDLADPERDLFAQLRGFEQRDWHLRLKPSRTLQLETFLFNARNPLEHIGNRRQRTRLMWQPARNLMLGSHREEYRSQQLADSLYHDEYERNDLQYTLGIGQLNAYREQRQIGGTQANPLYQYTDYYRFQSRESDKQPLRFAIEERNTRAMGAVSERYRFYQAGYRLNNQLKLNFAHAEAQREGAPDESGQQIGLEYQIRQGTTLTFAESRTAKEGANGTRTLSAGLTQSVWGVLAIGGTYQEWRIDRTQTKAQSQVVIQSARPFNWLFLQGLQFDFRYGALADRGLWQQENKHFTMQATAFQHALKGGYVGVYVPAQGRAIDRYYQIESPAKGALRYNLLYKVRTYQDGRLFLIRQYHLEYQLTQKFSIVHDFQTHPEQGNPNVVLGSILQPTGFSNWALEWTLKPQVMLRGDYRIEWNEQQGRRIRRGGLSLSSNQADGVNYAVGYRVESEMFGGRKTTAHTFYLSTERKLDADRYLMLGIQWTHYEHRADPNIRRDQPRLTLELKQVF